MILTLSPELKQFINNLIARGAYPSAEAVLNDAVKALYREHERRRVEALLQESGIDATRIERLLQEAEDSGEHTKMAAQDWEDIEREALAILAARNSQTSF